MTLTQSHVTYIYEREARAAEQRAAVRAYDAMRAARPKKPPPFVGYVDTRTTGALVLAREIRDGHYSPIVRWT